jgi:hypothetical protein
VKSRARSQVRIFVRVAIPLRGLERLAERLNRLEHPDDISPMHRQLARILGLPQFGRHRPPGSDSQHWAAARGVLDYLMPVAAPGSRGIQLVPDEMLPETARGTAESVRELLRRVAGDDFVRHLRRCEQCDRWMVARYRNKIRCGRKCHDQVWTRPHRQAAAKRRGRQR